MLKTPDHGTKSKRMSLILRNLLFVLPIIVIYESIFNNFLSDVLTIESIQYNDDVLPFVTHIIIYIKRYTTVPNTQDAGVQNNIICK